MRTGNFSLLKEIAVYCRGAVRAGHKRRRHRRRVAIMTGLDMTVRPCHTPGTWQRALFHQAARLEIDPADLEALAEWDKLTMQECKARSLEMEATRKAVVSAAIAEPEPDQVVGSDKLARRIAGTPGLPGHHK